MRNPGSADAKRFGCTCSALDNHYGKGAVVDDQINPDFFVVDPNCPVHAHKDRVEVPEGLNEADSERKQD